jgi:hypothetical protein
MAATRECYLRVTNRSPNLDDDSTVEKIDEAAAELREAMTGTLGDFAKKKRWCARSKRCLMSDLKILRKELGGEARSPPSGYQPHS